MFPYKFAHSQKKDANLASVAFNSPFKRSNLDAAKNTTLNGSATKRVFDGTFSQSISSRQVESRTHGGPAFLHRAQEVEDSKPAVSMTVSRLVVSSISARF